MSVTLLIAALAVLLSAVAPGTAWAEDPVTTPPGDQTGTPTEADQDAGDSLDEEASTSAGAQRVTQRLADEFTVDPAKITELRGQNLGYGEIHHALSLARQMPGGLTEENLNQVLTMRQEQKLGWGQIAHELGTTVGEAKHADIEPPPLDPMATGGVHDTGTGGTEATGSATAQPQSLSRPGSSGAQSGKGKRWGFFGRPSHGGLERSGGGKAKDGVHGTRGGAVRGGGFGPGPSGGGHGKSSQAPGHNR